MSELLQPSLTILDVGHGNAAVLRDLHGVVVFDAGRGSHLSQFLHENGITTVEALLLSHADTDHSGGAISVLCDDKLHVKHVYLNPDPTKKNSVSFKQLCLAVATAKRERGTATNTQLNTTLTGQLDQGAVHIEVLYPPPEIAMMGVGGIDLHQNSISSNSLSAAIRLLYHSKPVVLLGADIEFSCLEDLKTRSADASAQILVFPHHGGLPGNSAAGDAGTFAYQVGQYVRPEVVVFSIHRTRHELPREDVIQALVQAVGGIRFLCTQVPKKVSDIVVSQNPGPWLLHRDQSSGCKEGNITIEFLPDQYLITVSDSTQNTS